MSKALFFTSNKNFEKEFARCCNLYESLEIYSAWVGNRKNVLPFEYLNSLKKITAVIGVAFCQSHPDGIRLLQELSAEVRIAHDRLTNKNSKANLYHPKVYFFSKENKRAVFIGSSNFTFQGFYKNHEANVLIEGTTKYEDILNFQNHLRAWQSNSFSFIPDTNWINEYEKRYNKRRQKVRNAGLDDEMDNEERISNTSAWLAIGSWETYMRRFRSGLRNHERQFDQGLSEMFDLFDKYSSNLSTPWDLSIFNDKERRKMIGGIKEYGWLGHVAANGVFRGLLANKNISEQRTIVSSINLIAKLSHPINYKTLHQQLSNLVALGYSMKVWGRLLAIVRPDLFCTISSVQVRRKVSRLLETSQASLSTVDGYLQLIQCIHQSPWYNSKRPSDKEQAEIWKRRVAFLDVIFYDETI